jgi:hypothetical protein
MATFYRFNKDVLFFHLKGCKYQTLKVISSKVSTQNGSMFMVMSEINGIIMQTYFDQITEKHVILYLICYANIHLYLKFYTNNIFQTFRVYKFQTNPYVRVYSFEVCWVLF